MKSACAGLPAVGQPTALRVLLRDGARDKWLPVKRRDRSFQSGSHGGGFGQFLSPPCSGPHRGLRAGMRHGKASMPVFSARMHCPSKISADKCTDRTEYLHHGARGGGFGQSPSPMLGVIARPARGDASQEDQHARSQHRGSAHVFPRQPQLVGPAGHTHALSRAISHQGTYPQRRL